MPDDSRTVKPFSEYLDALEKEGSWGGFLEVYAFAKVQKFNVLVIDADINKAFRFEGGDDASPYVVLKFAAKHYEWVKCNSAAIASLWIEADEPEAKGHRGAAKRVPHTPVKQPCKQVLNTPLSSLHLSNFQSSAKQSSAKHTSSRGNKSVKSKGSSLHLSIFKDRTITPGSQSRNAKKKKSLQLTQFAESSAAAEPSPSRKLTKAVGVEEKHWVCDKCSLILRSTCTPLLSAKRIAHIRKHHADLPRNFFHQIQPRQTIIPASHGLSLSTGGWQCAWCDQRLPPLPVGQRKASARAHLNQCSKAPKQATMSQNVKALLPKLGYDPQASPAQVASLYAKAGRFEEIRNSSSHDLTSVGAMGRHASFACSRCCRYWCRIDVLHDCHDSTECSSQDRRNNILQRIATLQKMSAPKKNQVIQCWKLTQSEKELVRKAARTESSDPSKQLSKMTGHSIIAVPTPQEKVHKFSYTCQKCTGQWRAWSQAKKQATAIHCQENLRRTNLRTKRRWWERVRPSTRVHLMKAWKLTASEKAILDSAPGLVSQQKCG